MTDRSRDSEFCFHYETARLHFVNYDLVKFSRGIFAYKHNGAMTSAGSYLRKNRRIKAGIY